MEGVSETPANTTAARHRAISELAIPHHEDDPKRPSAPIMERPERIPNGISGLNPQPGQSGGRGGLPENPAQGRRPVPNSAATSNGPTPLPPPPVPTLRKAPSSSNLSASNMMTPSQVINLAREAMRTALESESQAADAVGTGLKTGVTVDLSRKSIQKLPEEVVDILKNELERSVASELATSPLLTFVVSPCPITSCHRCRSDFPNAPRYAISTSGATKSKSSP